MSRKLKINGDDLKLLIYDIETNKIESHKNMSERYGICYRSLLNYRNKYSKKKPFSFNLLKRNIKELKIIDNALVNENKLGRKLKINKQKLRFIVFEIKSGVLMSDIMKKYNISKPTLYSSIRKNTNYFELLNETKLNN